MEIIPTSTSQVQTAKAFHLPITTLNDREVDVAIEFVSQANHDFDFVKEYSTSLVRDKMIAQSAGEMIAVLNQHNYVSKISGNVPFEISKYGWKRTLLQLEQIGRVDFKKYGSEPPQTESGHYLVHIEMDAQLMLDDIDMQARTIPGVLETGLFAGMADRLILAGEDKIEVKSRMGE